MIKTYFFNDKMCNDKKKSNGKEINAFVEECPFKV